MSVTVNSYSVADGLLIIDSSISSPANYKIHTFYVLCNGHYADEVVPFWDRVSPAYQQVMTAANRRSYIDLSIFPNGSQTFSVRCKHAKTISPVGSIIEDTPVDVVVENTSFRTLLTPLATSYPMGVVQRPIITDFTVPANVESATIPVSITAEDNVAVAAYMVNESATPPLAGAAGWTASAPTSYTVGTSGTKTLYAWAKDADGNVSEPVSATVTATFTASTTGAFTLPSITLQPVVSAPTLSGIQRGSFTAPAVTLRPAVAAPTLTGVQRGSFTMPAVTLPPTVTPPTLSGVGVVTGSGAFTLPAVTLRPIVTAPRLFGMTGGASIRAPSGQPLNLRRIDGTPFTILSI